MYKIIRKEKLAQNIYLMDVECKRIAKVAKPGQFIIVRVDEKGERIPLTICDFNKEKGTVTIVFQILGQSTVKMGNLNAGDFFMDFVGPLGKESEFINEKIDCLKNKKILFVAGGVGVAPIYPQVKWMKENGIKVDVIIGAKNKEMIILEKEIKTIANNIYITTDDGSKGYRGLVTNVIEELIKNQEKQYDQIITIGPMIMMKFVCKLTKELGIPTIVSLNPIMVDGTGMCGACRVSVGSEIKFACVDGPEFNGHLVNFDEAMRRNQIYKTYEGRKFLKEIEGDTHHGGCGICGGKV